MINLIHERWSGNSSENKIVPMKEAPILEEEGKEKKEMHDSPLTQAKKEIRELDKLRRASRYREIFGDTYFGFKEEECDYIEKILKDAENFLLSIENDSKIVIEKNPNLAHIIGNLLMAEIGYINRVINKLKDLPSRKNIGEDEYSKILENSLKEAERNHLLYLKKASNYLIYYFDLIRDKNYGEILLEECKEQGWLESFSNYYKLDEKTEVKKIPVDALIQLKHINFFARLEGRKSDIGEKMTETKEICEPISSEEEFQKAYEELEMKECLDEDALRRDFVKQKLKKAA